MSRNPLAEVFGFPPDDLSAEAERYRRNRLCPYNNRVPSCTKDRASDPLGVCSIRDASGLAITCPVRFRERWIAAEAAAEFFFPEDATWTSLTEVRLADKHGQSAGNIDVVLVSYDAGGSILDFGALEVQAVYISGNVRRPFEYYMASRADRYDMDWSREAGCPRADYLSSSRKRLVPQLIYKGGILRTWGKKLAVALHTGFYATLPELGEVDQGDAEVAWLVYELQVDPAHDHLALIPSRTVYTLFAPALDRIGTAQPGDVDRFIEHLQERLDEELESPPEATAPGNMGEV